MDDTKKFKNEQIVMFSMLLACCLVRTGEPKALGTVEKRILDAIEDKKQFFENYKGNFFGKSVGLIEIDMKNLQLLWLMRTRKARRKAKRLK